MCVIAVSESEKHRPTLADLKLMEAGNRDGAGVAWVERGMVRWQKGIDAEQAFALTKDLTGPVVYHFRVATAGGVRPELCHPFPVGASARLDLEGKANSVLFHNGMWGEWRSALRSALLASGDKMPLGAWSDTRALAYLVQKHGKNFLSLIDGFNRFAHLNSKGDVTLFGDFTQYKGYLVSNTFFCSTGFISVHHGGREFAATAATAGGWEDDETVMPKPRRRGPRGMPLGPVRGPNAVAEGLMTAEEARAFEVEGIDPDGVFLDPEFAAAQKLLAP